MPRLLYPFAEVSLVLLPILAGLAAALTVWAPVRVTGGSMSPALEPGDLVLVRKGAQPHTGDVVLLRSSSGRMVLHRVVRTMPAGVLRTKGDANRVVDMKAASKSDVVGTAELVLPLGQVLARWRARRL